jgi:hypothetical protein
MRGMRQPLRGRARSAWSEHGCNPEDRTLHTYRYENLRSLSRVTYRQLCTHMNWLFFISIQDV